MFENWEILSSNKINVLFMRKLLHLHIPKQNEKHPCIQAFNFLQKVGCCIFTPCLSSMSIKIHSYLCAKCYIKCLPLGTSDFTHISWSWQLFSIIGIVQ